MARRIRFRRNFSVGRVIAKVVGAVLALYVGGEIVDEIGSVMNGTESPFYPALELIGWTVGTDGGATACATTENMICEWTGSGILSVIGIIAIASVVMEFVHVKM